ncbi:hypothetical protein K491DRAFT_707444 [Lophiostoma macrostomum CBS 122681]|uniref:Cupredoxin n=1 Tax=Lophiostoma macrostomum CBS 122681 TaxID=1314788 RepID=A0A6A6SSB2_9PLEO|nr:hypothetical protein K491DRAFT_707444 [Lophiostoma macrostomum CBS 122681]
MTMPWNESNSTRPTSTVIVGAGGQLVFSPPTVNASIGTVISFDFLSLNHTLTQSEFSNPCQANGEFDTGFRQFNPANVSGSFVVEYEVTALEPQWFFCAQTLKKSHCHAGMVFSLNSGGAQKQFLHNALSAVVTKPSVPACPSPTFSVVPSGSVTGIPSSTRLATLNIVNIGFGTPEWITY